MNTHNLFLILSLSLLTSAGCTFPTKEPACAPMTISTHDKLPNGTIPLPFTMTNCSAETLRVPGDFACGETDLHPLYARGNGLTLLLGGEPVAVDATDMLCNTSLHQGFDLQPGEARSFYREWNGTYSGGACPNVCHAPAGSYVLKATIQNATAEANLTLS